MLAVIRFLWRWATEWLRRYELFDFVTNKLGLVTLWAKAAPVGAALVTAILAYIGRAPSYIILLAALSAAVLILVAIRLTQIIVKRNEMSSNVAPTIKSKSMVAAQKSTLRKNTTSHIAASDARQQRNIGGFLAIAAAVIIASVGTNLYNNWTTYKEKLDQTSLLVIPIPRPPVLDRNQSFGVDVHWGNSGPLTIRGVRRQHHFEYPKQIMSTADIDKQYPPLSAALAQQDIPLLDELRPGAPGEWRTLTDERFTATDWKNVMNGSLFVYMFATFRYLVDDTSKDTEVCMIITTDYPQVHKCEQHNQTIISK